MSVLRDVPLIMHLGPVSPLWPLGVLIIKGMGTPARKWLFVSASLSLLADSVSLALALNGVNNHWVSYLLTPLFGAAILVTLSYWHQSRSSRYSIRIAAAVLVGIAGILTLTLEDLTTFSNYASPLRSLLILGVSAWTLLDNWRSSHRVSTWWREECFWVVIGFALYSAVSASISPLSALLTKYDVSMMFLLFQVKSVLMAISFILISVGILWRTPASSGLSS